MENEMKRSGVQSLAPPAVMLSAVVHVFFFFFWIIAVVQDVESTAISCELASAFINLLY